MHANVPEEPHRMYNWSFHIHHPGLGKHVLWDIGISKNHDDYTPRIIETWYKPAQACGMHKPISAQLAQKGVESTQISEVIFSHAHMDHCRPIQTELPQATGFFGPGTKAFCSPGHFRLHVDEIPAMFDGRFFDPDHATERCRELDGPWVPFGPFPQAMDFFGDGSFWVIQAPGHMPGNLCAAAKLETAEWVVLGSDCCHSRELFLGVHEYPIWMPLGGLPCLHTDMEAAKDTIMKLRILQRQLGAHVAFAHDSAWMLQDDDDVLMSLLDDDFKTFVKERLKMDLPY
ncbi:hypothetical protein LTR06_009666 [Exophiala xenobiotica]|nr:hypothetical protein LTR06_009666 [Exophiala xenobiotica]